MKKFGLLCFSMLAAALIAAPANKDVYAEEKTDSKAAEGIYLGDISVGGMTSDDIKKEVEKYISGFTSKTITLTMDDNKYDLTAGALGYRWGNKIVVEEILD